MEQRDAHLWPELTSMQPLNLEAAMGSTGTASAATMVTSWPSKHTVCVVLTAGRQALHVGAHGGSVCRAHCPHHLPPRMEGQAVPPANPA